MNQLQGKTIILTGAGGNVGWQYAEDLIREGAFVDLWEHNSDKAKKLEEFLQKNGLTEYRLTVVDVTDEACVNEAVESLIKQRGRIDVLINNAAMNPAVGSDEAKAQFVPYEQYSIDVWQKELAVNMTGPLICTKAVAPHMMRERSGSIINVGSEVSLIAHDHRVYQEENKFKSIGYVTTKTAMLGFTRQWAARLGEYNVRVNTFSPGGMKTSNVPDAFAARFGGMNMLGRMAKEHEYSGAVIFLASDASSFMTGQNLVVDGGKTAW